MWFTRTLKKTDLGWLILIIGLFVFLPGKASAGGVDSACWKDYPAGGAPIPGFPKATDFALPGKCKGETTFAALCVNQGGVDANGGFGCDPGLKCCLYPATHWICANNYLGDSRANITQTSCVKTDAQCASPNFKMADGAGCTDANGGPVCCAIVKGGAAASAGGKGAAIPQTGSTAAWISSVPGGLVLVPCTQSGNCTIDDLVNQGINFAKWIMGLAGALFLLVFVYGGAMYVASFGKSDYVTKGKKALIRGAIGIVLVMGAWTIVSYVATSLGYAGVGVGGSAGGSKGICGQATGTEGRTCMDTNAAGKGKDCLPSYCPGVASIQCCK